ncbi:hypothetical protein OS493_030743 [Desmophyllum pertusum]|uniref:Uncharacterized protein n=1 Tax=Desmophyllum pertusum TaxID=174260 RepID=A0A9W9Z8P8_9CNID|nr:hypothetical protein OS493_030743 [Desmophyllum pertusum]
MKEVSQAAQEAKLDRELLRFEEELELFLADKDLFLEELYRRLKQITSLWKSWRCQRLRDVSVTQLVSAKQIEDLIYWEQNLPGKKKTATKAEKPADMLIRFLQACHESKQLYEQFFFSIYKPLHQLFDDEKAAPFAEALGEYSKSGVHSSNQAPSTIEC